MSNVQHVQVTTELKIGRQPSELYMVLFHGLPEHRTMTKNRATLNAKKIADDLGIRKQNVYRWLLENILPARRCNGLMSLPGSTLKRENLERFLTSE
ncbi:hypothetical protein WKW50_16195 [Ochrobactrum sp. GPK 3]